MNLFDFNVVWKDVGELLKYLHVTLKLTLYASLIALVLGLLIAVVQIKRIKIMIKKKT